MKHQIILFTSFIILSACSKTEIEPDPIVSPEIGNFLPMAIGNYWIYQHYSIDSFLQTHPNYIQPLQKYDSLYIVKDTTIRQNQYFVFENSKPFGRKYRYLRRDSSGYVVDENGIIRFSRVNFEDVLHINSEIISNNFLIHTDTFEMVIPKSKVEVPAGKYWTLNYRGRHDMFISVNDTNVVNPRFMHNYYAQGVGRILITDISGSMSKYLEYRLIRYHLNN